MTIPPAGCVKKPQSSHETHNYRCKFRKATRASNRGVFIHMTSPPAHILVHLEVQPEEEVVTMLPHSARAPHVEMLSPRAVPSPVSHRSPTQPRSRTFSLRPTWISGCRLWCRQPAAGRSEDSSSPHPGRIGTNSSLPPRSRRLLRPPAFQMSDTRTRSAAETHSAAASKARRKAASADPSLAGTRHGGRSRLRRQFAAPRPLPGAARIPREHTGHEFALQCPSPPCQRTRKVR